MIISVYNFKGGVGKTGISLNLALTLDYGVITNDIYSPLEKILKKEDLLKVAQNQTFKKLPKEADIIYDLGGHIDQRAILALKQSEYIIVPTINDFVVLQVTVNSIKEIEKYNSNIIVVANRVRGRGDDYKSIRQVIGKFYNKYPVTEIKESKAIPNIFEEKKSVRAMVSEGGLKKYHYQIVSKQFNYLIKIFKKDL